MQNKFYTIKTSEAGPVRKIQNKESNIELAGLNILKREMKLGTLVFLVFGGDRVPWTNGLIGVGEITKEPYDEGYDKEHKKNYKLGIDVKLVLDRILTRSDFIPYRETYGIIGIGPMLKGEPNQALSAMTRTQAVALLKAVSELCPSSASEFKSLFGEELYNGIYTGTRKLIEVPFEYGEDVEHALNRYLNAEPEDAEEETGLTMEQYEAADLNQRKEYFKDWMSKITKPGTTPPYTEDDYYRPNTIANYATLLVNRCARLENFPYEHKNLYYYTTPEEYVVVESTAKSAPNYPEVNEISFSGGFGPAMDKYYEFLTSLTRPAGEESEEKEHVEDGADQAENTEIIIHNCLDVTRAPRTVKIHPLNFIIYGAPGTGKTYSTAEYANAVIENREADLSQKTAEERRALMQKYDEYAGRGQIVFTTFHQNYGYEEFIQGLRPDPDAEHLSFKPVDGVFKTIAWKALNDHEKNYVIIIDEINRANISKVFGELITLIEEDKRWGEANQLHAVLPSNEPFAVPNNLYIIGTMNSADKSISLIDAALRRRFVFVEKFPDKSLIGDAVLQNVFSSLNEQLAEELESTDLLIGHSYFIGRTKADLCEILNNSVIPLLYEYFYDSRKKVNKVLRKAISGPVAEEIEIMDESFRRLYVRRKENSEA